MTRQSNRQNDMMGFLVGCGWDDATRIPLAGDASPRRYQRLVRERSAQRAILMDADPALDQDVAPFLHVGAFLHDAGFSAPRIIAQDTNLGFVLMEDLGDLQYARLCQKQPEIERPLYDAAIDVLTALYRQPPPPLPPYGPAEYLREARLATDWYFPAASGAPLPEDQKQEFENLIANATDAVAPTRPSTVLRDCHAENLMWLPTRQGLGRVGLLDFQDALTGHPAYDVVSLLEDARRDVSPQHVSPLIARFVAATELEEAPFRQAYATLGAQRNLKIIGIFTRLFKRDGLSVYLPLIPRVWAHLETDLAHPSLAKLRRFVLATFPRPTPAVLRRIREGEPVA